MQEQRTLGEPQRLNIQLASDRDYLESRWHALVQQLADLAKPPVRPSAEAEALICELNQVQRELIRILNRRLRVLADEVKWLCSQPDLLPSPASLSDRWREQVRIRARLMELAGRDG